ncbi:hypothetical protein AC629_41230 [Bradyrhizobium sp. NAS80.1]|nr:hypothetical protein AC629_41230 [Bradyrhizobium sp. NAS80.1]
MSKGRHLFTQPAITRAVKAVLAAGVSVAEVEIGRDGSIRIIVGEPAQAHNPAEVNEWDTVK